MPVRAQFCRMERVCLYSCRVKELKGKMSLFNNKQRYTSPKATILSKLKKIRFRQRENVLAKTNTAQKMIRSILRKLM